MACRAATMGNFSRIQMSVLDILALKDVTNMLPRNVAKTAH
jgi:hypothetical protein